MSRSNRWNQLRDSLRSSWGDALLQAVTFSNDRVQIDELGDLRRGVRASPAALLAGIEQIWNSCPLVDDPAVVLVLYAIGQGMRLRLPHDGSSPSLVEGQKHHGRSRPDFEIPAGLAAAALATDHLHCMARDRVDRRTGWAEAGLDGTKADFYCIFL